MPPPATAHRAIAPVRVVQISAAPGRRTLRLCPRCRGEFDPNAQFCAFAGPRSPTRPWSRRSGPAHAAASRRLPDALAAGSRLHLYLQAPCVRRPRRPCSTAGYVLDRSPGPRPASAAVARPPRAHRPRRRRGPGLPAGRSRRTSAAPRAPSSSATTVPLASPRPHLGSSGHYYLRDLGSTNGRLRSHPLRRRRGAALNGLATTSARPAVRRPCVQAKLSAADANARRGHWPIRDQDLFLVGQQVLRFEVVKHAEEGFGAGLRERNASLRNTAAPRYARLSQRTVEGVIRDVFHMRKRETVIGRESGDIVFTEDPFLSRRHAAGRAGMPPAARRAMQRRFSLIGSRLVERHFLASCGGDAPAATGITSDRPAALPVRPRRGCTR